MSGLDGLADAKELVNTAAGMRLSGLAITDHGVVQAFPFAFDANMALKKSGKDLKLIYGVEAYMANDMAAFTGEDEEIGEVVVFDIETTGLDKKENEIIEVGAVRWKDGQAIETFESFARPLAKLPPEIVKLTALPTRIWPKRHLRKKPYVHLQNLWAVAQLWPTTQHLMYRLYEIGVRFTDWISPMR